MRFTKESLTQLAVGAMVEFGPMFPGLSPEPIVGQVTAVRDTPGCSRAVVFAMHYLDTFIGSKTVRSADLKPKVKKGGKK